MKTITAEEALNRAMRLCSREEKCRADIKQKFYNWKIPSTTAEELLDRLEAENFISNKRFAEAYARDKFRFNKWGRQKIAAALRQKQIDTAAIEDALDALDELPYRETVFDELQKKFRTTGSDLSQQGRAKLLRFGQSRGYETDLIFSFLETKNE